MKLHEIEVVDASSNPRFKGVTLCDRRAVPNGWIYREFDVDGDGSMYAMPVPDPAAPHVIAAAGDDPAALRAEIALLRDRLADAANVANEAERRLAAYTKAQPSQPAPTVNELSRPVFDSILAVLEPVDLGSPYPVRVLEIGAAIDSVTDALKSLGVIDGAKFIELLKSRAERGCQTYGTDLMTHNGRDAVRDAIEELADALVYLWQRKMELLPVDHDCNRVRP